jgi:hypothetical protein
MDPAIRDQAMEALARDKNPKLRVTIDATHSGVKTNKRVYPGKFVLKGHKSFFSKENGGDAEFDKPVLKHHDMYEDPIGRVVKASFTALKQGRAFEEDFLAPDEAGSKGSGVVTVEALITDLESIQKIIDGRYLSVSAGHHTDSMTCSICSKSILKCDHWPGKYYDEEGEECDSSEGFECFYITGNMDYDELSFVNMPAQPPAKLLNFNWQDFDKSSFEKDNLLIKSMVRGKKSMVHDFSLVDDDGEFNLLKGLYLGNNKKITVAMTGTAKKDLGQPEETKNVLQIIDTKKGSADDANIANSKNKDTNKMDPETTKNGLDVNTLETSLKAVTAEKDKLTSAKAEVDAKIIVLEGTVASKTSEIERLTKANTDIQVELSKALASALTSFRVKLGKPDTAGLDTLEKFNKYVTDLSKRSPDSLRDSISDIVLELNQPITPAPLDKDKPGANSIVAGDKVTNPSALDTKNKTVQAGKETPSKTPDNKTAIDIAFNN